MLLYKAFSLCRLFRGSSSLDHLASQPRSTIEHSTEWKIMYSDEERRAIEKERIKLLCCQFRKQLKLSNFRLRVCQGKYSGYPTVIVISPTGNEYVLGYVDMNFFGYGHLLVGYVADFRTVKIEESIANAHLQHVLSALKQTGTSAKNSRRPN